MNYVIVRAYSVALKPNEHVCQMYWSVSQSRPACDAVKYGEGYQMTCHYGTLSQDRRGFPDGNIIF
jgi:hypothetical protein